MSKVLLVNGSPKQYGCTNAALDVVAAELAKCGIETEMFWCGNKPIMGCIGCGRCSGTKRCWYDKDTMNAFSRKPNVQMVLFSVRLFILQARLDS